MKNAKKEVTALTRFSCHLYPAECWDAFACCAKPNTLPVYVPAGTEVRELRYVPGFTRRGTPSRFLVEVVGGKLAGSVGWLDETYFAQE